MGMSHELSADIDACPMLGTLLAAHVESLRRATAPWQSGFTYCDPPPPLSDSLNSGQEKHRDSNTLVDLQYLADYSNTDVTAAVLRHINHHWELGAQSHRSGPPRRASVDDTRRRSMSVEQKGLAASATVSAVCLALGLNEQWALDTIRRNRLRQVLTPGLALEIYGASTVCNLVVSNETRLVALGKLEFELVAPPPEDSAMADHAFLAATRRQLDTAQRHCEALSRKLENSTASDHPRCLLVASDVRRYNMLKKTVRQYQAQTDVYVHQSREAK